MRASGIMRRSPSQPGTGLLQRRQRHLGQALRAARTELPSSDKIKGLSCDRPFILFGGEGGMIRHYVAYPFGAACGRSLQQAALLEPGEGSYPPSST